MMNVQNVGVNFTGKSQNTHRCGKGKSFVAGAVVGSALTATGFVGAKAAGSLRGSDSMLAAKSSLEGVKVFFGKAWKFMKNAGSKVKDGAVWLWNGAKKVVNYVASGAKSLYNTVKNHLPKAKKPVTPEAPSVTSETLSAITTRFKSMSKNSKIGLAVGAATVLLGATALALHARKNKA